MKKQQMRRAIVWLCLFVWLGGSLCIGFPQVVHAAESGIPKLDLTGTNLVGQPLALISSEILGEGVVTGKFRKVIDGQTSIVHITKVDLSNPYAEIVALYGQHGKLTPRQHVRALAEQKEDVVAAVNADFFHLNRIGTPFGIVLDQGELISSMGQLEGWHSLGITEDKRAVIEYFRFSGQVTAPNGKTFPIFGVNKEPYNASQGNSHENRLHLYTPAWGQTTPAGFEPYNQYVRLHVQDNRVTRIEENAGARTFLHQEQILWGHGQAASFLKENFQVGDPIQIEYLTGGEAFNLATAVGGHALLVDKGQVRSTIYPNIPGEHARSAVGISQDGQTVYFVTVEQHSGSRGMSLENLARVLVEAGAYKAANLDGGGSTTLVGRRLGDVELSVLNQTRTGSLRAVPTGIGVVNKAPRGRLAGFEILGDDYLFRGDSLSFEVKGYDEHFHPYSLEASQLSWSIPEEFGRFEDATLFAQKRGYTRVQAEYEGVLSSKDIVILGGEDIKELQVTPGELRTLVDSSVTLELNALLSTGERFILKEENMDSITVTPSDLGQVEGLTFTGRKEGEGTLSIRIDQLEKHIPVRVGSVEVPWPVLDALTNIYHTGHPSTLANKGSFRLSKAGEPVHEGEHSLRLAYNFEGASSGDVRIAYGQLGQGIRLPEQAIGLGIWIYGDNSGHWARALVTGADGKDHYIDLAKEVDWTGWKYTQGVLPSHLTYPATLKSLYLVNPVEGNQLRPLQGTIYFDHLSFLFPYGMTNLPKPAPSSPAETAEGTNPFKDLEQHWAKAYVLPLAEQGIIQGMSADTFHPDGKITRAQLATLLDRMLDWGLDETQPIPFKDSLPSYAERSIRAAEQHGVMLAFQDGTFRPNEPVTRAQLALYLHRALQTDLSGNVNYRDQEQIPEWAREAVKQMSLLGILQGDDQQRFLPAQHVTRAQVAAVLYRLAQP